MTKTRMEDREIGRKKTVGPQKLRREFESGDCSVISNAIKRSSDIRNMNTLPGLGNIDDSGELIKAFLMEWGGSSPDILIQRCKPC